MEPLKWHYNVCSKSQWHHSRFCSIARTLIGSPYRWIKLAASIPTLGEHYPWSYHIKMCANRLLLCAAPNKYPSTNLPSSFHRACTSCGMKKGTLSGGYVSKTLRTYAITRGCPLKAGVTNSSALVIEHGAQCGNCWRTGEFSSTALGVTKKGKSFGILCIWKMFVAPIMILLPL